MHDPVMTDQHFAWNADSARSDKKNQSVNHIPRYASNNL